jgi:mediator of RNA polymerase II transcription subunit 6
MLSAFRALLRPVFFQLTSVSALQSSLDILRKHRPDYTPRSGFIWPISDPSLVIDAEASKTRDSEAQNQNQNYGSDHSGALEERGSSPLEKRGPETSPRRQKNTMLLMNAMKTTAAHSKMSFTQTGSLQSQQSTNELIDHQADSGTPVTGTMPSSPTPGPSGPQTAGSRQETSQEGPKGPPTGVKKKKKRLFDSLF